MIISEKDKRVTAYHEAGHALVARLIPGTDPVHKVTIIPRGRSLGLTQLLPEEDRLNLTKTYTQAKIAWAMGGRIAEELVFGELSTGAGMDIQTATDLARKMVCEWGMNEKLGPVYYGKKEEAIFLGREIAQHQEFSEQTAEVIDAEVHKTVMDQYHRARGLIETNREALERIAHDLLEYEVLDGETLDDILRDVGAEGEVSYRRGSRSVPRSEAARRSEADSKRVRAAISGEPEPVEEPEKGPGREPEPEPSQS
jgi:cell division protease FtsH